VDASSVLKHLGDGYRIRRTAIDRNVSLVSNVQLVKELILALYEMQKHGMELSIKAWDEYKKNNLDG
jgi:hypothetical protein